MSHFGAFQPVCTCLAIRRVGLIDLPAILVAIDGNGKNPAAKTRALGVKAK